MTVEAARSVIAALRSVHDGLVSLVGGLDETGLARTSGSSQWDVAQVLSHLGSGAQIGLAALEASVNGEPAPDMAFNQLVWDTWNARDNAAKRANFVPADTALVERYESFDDEALANQQIRLGFLPHPIDIATAGAFRLGEAALHAWDVAVAFDDAATVPAAAVPIVLGNLGHLIGRTAKADTLPEGATIGVTLTDTGQKHTLVIGPETSLTEGVPASADSHLSLPSEAFVRLVYGRLTDGRTPASVTVTGKCTLADLRRVFPGF